MQDLDDIELLNSLKEGSLEAYEILFKKYYKVLCLEAALFLMDNAEAEDLVIELFTEIWDKKIYKKIDHSFKSYIYKAVRNRCINLYRKKEMLREKKNQYRAYCLNEKAHKRAEERELTAGINDVLKEFPAQRLRAFTLVYMEEKRYQQAADEMGLTINSVKTHLKLAMNALRSKLEKFK